MLGPGMFVAPLAKWMQGARGPVLTPAERNLGWADAHPVSRGQCWDLGFHWCAFLATYQETHKLLGDCFGWASCCTSWNG